jgi:predicted transcriptional regulator
MELHLTSEQAVQLSRFAFLEGRLVEDLAREVVDRYLAEEARFHAAVQAGRDAAARGEFVPSMEVWDAVERDLRV